MTIALYKDVHVHRAITNGLRIRGVDVLTAQEDKHRMAPDDRLLDRATELGRVLFTQDDDLLAEAKRRQTRGVHFTGVIYTHQMHITIGRCVADCAAFHDEGDRAIRPSASRPRQGIES